MYEVFTYLHVMVLAWKHSWHSGDTPDEKGLSREN